MEANLLIGAELENDLIPVLQPQSRDLEGEKLTLSFTREGSVWRALVGDVDGHFGAGAPGATPAEAVQNVFKLLQIAKESIWRIPA